MEGRDTSEVISSYINTTIHRHLLGPTSFPTVNTNYAIAPIYYLIQLFDTNMTTLENASISEYFG